MRDVMGIIYTSKNDLTLRELTMSRAVAALPVAGRYRMIDFMLSNMVNTGIRNVGIIMQRNYHSLMDHLGSGREWDLHIRNDGLFILPPFLTKDNIGTYSGIIDALRSNMGYLRRSKQEYVILTHSHTALNTTFTEMLRAHNESDADITLMYKKMKHSDLEGLEHAQLRKRAYLELDAKNQVVNLEIGPLTPSGNNCYMDIMLLKRRLLIQLLEQSYAYSFNDLNRDLQRYITNKLLKVSGYQCDAQNWRVENVNSYFNFNLDLLQSAARKELFGRYPIYTKLRSEPPAYYSPSAVVRDSLVADGCIIEGHVENCVLFRGVTVGKGAVVKNSILMQEDSIQDGVELENVILDKNVTVRAGERLIAPRHHPVLVAKNTMI